jgi:hypothetical protein
MNDSVLLLVGGVPGGAEGMTFLFLCYENSGCDYLKMTRGIGLFVIFTYDTFTQGLIVVCFLDIIKYFKVSLDSSIFNVNRMYFTYCRRFRFLEYVVYLQLIGKKYVISTYR